LPGSRQVIAERVQFFFEVAANAQIFLDGFVAGERRQIVSAERASAESTEAAAPFAFLLRASGGQKNNQNQDEKTGAGSQGCFHDQCRFKDEFEASDCARSVMFPQGQSQAVANRQ
jgi:hypothetical protein